MKTAMGNGLSALFAYQKAMAVESHNAANTKSVSYKADTVSFADMFYSDSVGLGVSMTTPIKNFGQGSLAPTNSEYDFAIDGEGFFQMQDPLNPEQQIFTRAGQFKSDKFNYLSDLNGMRVLGMNATVSGDMITSDYPQNIASIVVNGEDTVTSINTYSSDFKKAAKLKGETGTSGTNYKTVDSNISDIEALISSYTAALKAYSITEDAGVAGDVSKAQSTVTFPILPATDEKYTLEISIDGTKIQQSYEDSVENTLKLFSDKINELAGVTSNVDTTTGVLTIDSMISGKKLAVTQASLNDNNIAIVEVSEEGGTGRALLDQIYSELQAAMGNVDAIIASNESAITRPESGVSPAVSPLLLDLNSLGMNSTLYEKLLSGDIDKIAAYPGIESDDGYLYLTDGDAKFLIGKIAPVTFTDKTQLKPEGDNLYTLNDPDMVPVYVENLATVRGRYLENSNVDLSEQLVDLLTYQKAFEANSKSISTSDEMMKTALALKNR